MTFTNSYAPQPPTPLTTDELYGPQPYDVNFCLPVRPEALENERVQLTPFIPQVHIGRTWEVLSVHGQEVFRYFRSINSTREAFLTWHERSIRQDPKHLVFAIIDKTRLDEANPGLGGSLAGLIGLIGTSVEQLTTEIAFVVIFPAFQRTHVATNAVGILMKYCLELPSAPESGLGLRRVQWHCHTKNLQSKALAERMGFRYEGIFKWHAVLPEVFARDGAAVSRKDDPADEKPGRHTIALSVCWDDWESGVREKVQCQIDRRV